MVPDIFGMAFNDYLSDNKGECIEVISNVAEDTHLPVAYFFRDYDMMPAGERKIMDECCGSVLDVGAGAGSHALYLQKAGCEVTAIDFSEGAVKAMKRRGVKNVYYVDFFDFTGKKFDNILFLMNGAGIARTISGLNELLKHAKSLLKNNGTIYIESTDILYMFEEDDGSYLVDLGGDYYGEVIYKLKYKSFKGKEFKWLFVDRDNMFHIAGEAGLKAEMFYDSGKTNYIVKLTAEY